MHAMKEKGYDIL